MYIYIYIYIRTPGPIGQDLQAKRAAMALAVKPADAVSPPMHKGESDVTLAYPTEVSQTTPGKALKKARVEAPESEEPERRALNFSDESQEGGPSGGGTGGTSEDQINLLRTLNMKLISEKRALEQQVADLQNQLSDLSIDAVATGERDDVGPPTSDEAARKRLARICKRNAGGMHGQWLGSWGLGGDTLVHEVTTNLVKCPI